jgi:DNA-binding transcriptional LysR family regulator
MEFRQLRYFVAVAEERHFGRAARRLHLSQPPLSMQIRHLEEELGVRLLDRNTRRVMLTDAGRVFLERAYRILAEAEQARHVACEAQSGLSGQLEIGFISSSTLTVLPPALREFRCRYPAVAMELKEITSGDQVDALYRGEIQLGLLRLPLQAPGLYIEPLLRESLAVALPVAHELARQQGLSLEMLAKYPLIFFDRQHIPGLHDHIQGLFQTIGQAPRVAQYAISLQTIVGLVASHIGIAILPESSRHLHRDGVVYRPLESAGTNTWLALAHLESMHSLLGENFKQTLHDVVAESPGQ